MKNWILLLLFLFPTFAATQDKATKPVILIQGDGNITVISDAGVVGGNSWAVASSQTRLSEHDQTMEMAQDFLQFCPAVQTTLDRASTPDYFIALNREGGAYNIGQSQIMVLNRRKVVIFVTKKATVKNAVKSACNSIAADWQSNGRLADLPPTPSQILPAANGSAPPVQHTEQRAPVPSPELQQRVVLVLQTTASAQKRCKPQTIADVMSDTTAYLNAKGVAIGTIENSSYALNLIINRPVSKWLEITIQAKDKTGNLLWSQTVSDGGWGHLGTEGTLKVLEKVHQVIDAKLGIQNGLPPLLPVQKRPTGETTPANSPGAASPSAASGTSPASE